MKETFGKVGSSWEVVTFREGVNSSRRRIYYRIIIKFCLLEETIQLHPFYYCSYLFPSYSHQENIKFCTDSGTVRILAKFCLMFKFSHLWNLSFCIWKLAIHSEFLQNLRRNHKLVRQHSAGCTQNLCFLLQQGIPPVGRRI